MSFLWTKRRIAALVIIAMAVMAIPVFVHEDMVVSDITELGLKVRYRRSLIFGKRLVLVTDDGDKLAVMPIDWNTDKKFLHIYHDSNSIVIFTGSSDGIWKKELWEKWLIERRNRSGAF